MGTPFQKPIDIFLGKIEEDKNFFRYYGLTDEEAVELAITRAKSMLIEASYMLSIRCKSDYGVNFSNLDEELEVYNEELNGAEIYLVGSMMYECYLRRDFAKIKLDNVNFTAAELKVFDPSNARSTFCEIYNTIASENKLLITEYLDTDRATGMYRGIDYSSYEEE